MKFSIVTPIYNSERFLKECIESVINQTYSDWELVLVNDGSTDNSKKICDLYSKEDTRIKLINQENKGQFFARMTGLKTVIGDYVLFLDSDDRLEKNSLYFLFTHLTENPVDIIWFSYLFDCEQIRNQFYLSYRDEIESNKPLEEIFAKRIGYFLWDKCFSKALFDNFHIDVDFEFNNFAEDTLMVYFISKNAKTIKIINEKLYYYRFNESSKVHSISIEDQIGRDYIYSYICSNIEQYFIPEAVKNVYDKKYIDLIFKTIQFFNGSEYKRRGRYILLNFRKSFNFELKKEISSSKKRIVFRFFSFGFLRLAKLLSTLLCNEKSRDITSVNK